MDFSGQHVVITGGSSGIGRATAERIAELGGKVTLVARRAAVLEEACKQIGALADFVVADAGDQEQIIAALDAATSNNGPIDGLFLNAAEIGAFLTTPDYPDDAFEATMRVNVFSLFWSVRHVLPAMIERGRGSILITGSLGSNRGMIGNTGYCVSKSAAWGFAQHVAMEAAPHGVRCNCIIPGFIDTQMMNSAPDEAKDAMARRTPQRRIGTPGEAGRVAAFLLSDDASHVTAQTLSVDGGISNTIEIV